MEKCPINKTGIRLGLYLIFLQLYDIYMTHTVISFGCTEGNPIVKYFIENFGILGGLILVKFLTICMIIILILYNKKYPLLFLLISYTITLGYVTIINYDIIF